MDKKQNLTPELKAIYERVMNTPVASSGTPAQARVGAQPAAAALPVAPQAPASVAPVTAEVPAQAAAAPAPVSEPPVPPVPAQAHTVTAQSVSAPSGSFVFNASQAHQPANSTAAVAAPNVMVSEGTNKFAKLVVFGGIVFLIGYIIFWLKFFKYL